MILVVGEIMKPRGNLSSHNAIVSDYVICTQQTFSRASLPKLAPAAVAAEPKLTHDKILSSAQSITNGRERHRRLVSGASLT